MCNAHSSINHSGGRKAYIHDSCRGVEKSCKLFDINSSALWDSYKIRYHHSFENFVLKHSINILWTNLPTEDFESQNKCKKYAVIA